MRRPHLAASTPQFLIARLLPPAKSISPPPDLPSPPSNPPRHRLGHPAAGFRLPRRRFRLTATPLDRWCPVTPDGERDAEVGRGREGLCWMRRGEAARVRCRRRGRQLGVSWAGLGWAFQFSRFTFSSPPPFLFSFHVCSLSSRMASLRRPRRRLGVQAPAPRLALAP